MRKIAGIPVLLLAFVVVTAGPVAAQTASDIATAAGWRTQAVKVVTDNAPEIGLTLLAVSGAAVVLFVGRMGLQLAWQTIRGRGRKIPV